MLDLKENKSVWADASAFAGSERKAKPADPDAPRLLNWSAPEPSDDGSRTVITVRSLDNKDRWFVTVGRDGTPHDKDAFVGTMEMNAIGTFNVSRLAAAAMGANEPDDEGERGVIVNTASIAGIEGQTGQLAYAAAKAAILGMTLPMARDLSPLGIRVCAIAPGTMGTPLMMSTPEELQAHLVSTIQFPKRMGKPEEFALLVESIVRNPYLNGESIRLDGALRFPPK